MLPADSNQGLVVHGLGVDAYAIDSPVYEQIQDLGLEGIRTTRFHGKLCCFRSQYAAVQGFQQLIPERCIQHCRGTPTNIQVIDYQVKLLKCLTGLTDFVDQGLKKLGQPRPVL
jgi:hypothetical protein